jgi:hypothetical protein
LFSLTLHIVGDFHIIAPQGVSVMELGVLAVFLVYGTYVAGVGLQVGVGTALSLVVLDFVISLIASQLIFRIEI